MGSMPGIFAASTRRRVGNGDHSHFAFSLFCEIEIPHLAGGQCETNGATIMFTTGYLVFQAILALVAMLTVIVLFHER